MRSYTHIHTSLNGSPENNKSYQARESPIRNSKIAGLQGIDIRINYGRQKIEFSWIRILLQKPPPARIIILAL
ncbi:MAG TPA: hypothetical protein DCS07_12375 [Bdellovibrionales bacterium]|nr:hypothetical protein [Bdellovibrionales bacterium]